MKRFNEGSAVSVSVEFLSDGSPTAPSTVHYKLRNLTARKTLIDWTEIGTSTSVDIAIPAYYIAIDKASNSLEIQELTVAANKGLATQIVEAIRWEVINLDGVE